MYMKYDSIFTKVKNLVQPGCRSFRNTRLVKPGQAATDQIQEGVDPRWGVWWWQQRKAQDGFNAPDALAPNLALSTQGLIL